MTEPAAARSSVPSGLGECVLASIDGTVPVGIAFVRLAMQTGTPEEFAHALAEASRSPLHPRVAGRLEQLRRLAIRHPGAWSIVRGVLDEVSHDRAEAADGAVAIAHCAAAFERAVQTSPEASVALYSLGDPDLLDAATNDVVARMHDWGLLARRRTLLEIGCGIGRFQKALAGEVGRVFGIDIAPAMVETARQRCAGLANVDIRLTTGVDLAGFGDGEIDCVFAVDTFPYIVAAGDAVVAGYFREASRVLRTGGDLLILNFSYRGDPVRDRADIADLCGRHGFVTARIEESTFRLWDGVAFHLVKRGK
ncbi:MAG: class I SAM-dependent methyltransferase [Methylobacteriaceae bacterium]|nr:class I SAM-dependent methyltransferase [Methylobacteriaceae bacterium]